jgi:hypothetical protein
VWTDGSRQGQVGNAGLPKTDVSAGWRVSGMSAELESFLDVTVKHESALQVFGNIEEKKVKNG